MRRLAVNDFRCTLFLLLMFPVPALAIPTITCHCFTDRSFDASRPAAADGYFLATTQNTFFALVFNTDKKNVIIKKQLGTSADDLWVAYWLASRSRASTKMLFQARQNNGNWKEALSSLGISATALDARFADALRAKASDAKLAEAVVDILCARYRLMGDAELAAMRRAAASNQELIIAAVIAAKTRQSARQIYLDVKKGATTWGALLDGSKITPKNMRQEMLTLLKM